MGELLLGFDVGSNSSKGVLCRPDGTLVAKLQASHEIEVPRPGWAEMDADRVWWRELCDVAQELSEKVPAGDRIAAVGVSGLGPCLVPVDRNGRPLRRAILYGVDTRSVPQIEELERRYGREEIRAHGGNRLSSQSLGPKILWFRENEPELARQVNRFLGSASYLVFRLTGEVALDRHTASNAGPLVDFESLTWSDRFAEGIATPAELPPIRETTEIAGEVNAEASEATGIPAGTPVTVGGADTMAEAISVGVTRPGDLMVMYGSSGFLLLVTGERRDHPDLWSTAGAFGGQYGLSGGLATAGSATAWFRDTLAEELVQAREAGGPPAYAVLAEEAARAPIGAHGVLFLPYLSGERTPLFDPEARGVITGLSLSHTRADLYRALLEGVAYAIRHNVDLMRECGAPIRRAMAVGGGTLNRLWLRIVSDVTGIAQSVPAQAIGASYGDAFLAGLATGLVPDAAALQTDWVKPGETIEPEPTATAAYEPLYAGFRSLYLETRETVHRLAEIGSG
ncbi:MAG TPA: FGGY-family carbohydrate kinase [Candidatus Limnocylindrales bacterium]